MEITGNSRVAGVGAYLPETRVTSESLMEEIDCTRFGAPASYLSRWVGIKERRISAQHILPSDMAIMASETALLDAGTAAPEIDLIVYCGIDRDWQEPATAHRVQAVLGADRATCLDVTNACHGFMNGLAIADSFIANGSIENALVCTGEKTSDVMYAFIDRLKKTKDKTDFHRWLGSLTVGDAGGAMVVQRATRSSGLKWVGFKSAGEYAELCYYRYGEDGLDGQMVMGDIAKAVVSLHSEMIEGTYRQLDWQPGSADWLYCHQAGSAPHRQLTQLTDMTSNSAPITYDYFGNLASASIPVNMSLNRPNRGDRLLILGAGSGISICQAGMVF